MSSPRLALLRPLSPWNAKRARTDAAGRVRAVSTGVILSLGLVLGVGCDPVADMRALDTDDLPERFACGDLTMVAASPDGDEALLIGIDDGLAAAAVESGEAVHAEYDLPDERLTVRWVAGSNVYQGQCGRDTGEAWQLDARLDALEGHIRVRVDPRPDGKLELRAEIDGVVLADDTWLVGTDLELPIE
jgi:hypothetical protein